MHQNNVSINFPQKLEHIGLKLTNDEIVHDDNEEESVTIAEEDLTGAHLQYLEDNPDEILKFENSEIEPEVESESESE